MLQVCGGVSCGTLVPKGQTRCQPCGTAKEQEHGSRHARGYDNDWARKSLQFRKAHPFCGLRADGQFHMEHSQCATEGRMADVVGSLHGRPRGVTDHIVPHKGNRQLFEDPSNWQSLCTHCHNRKSQTEKD